MRKLIFQDLTSFVVTFLIVAILFISPVSVLAENETPFIWLETICGDESCPEYSIGIFRDGRVRYEGKRHVYAKGINYSRIATADVQMLVEHATKLGFFTSPDNSGLGGRALRSISNLGCHKDDLAKPAPQSIGIQGDKPIRIYFSRLRIADSARIVAIACANSQLFPILTEVEEKTNTRRWISGPTISERRSK